LLFNFSGANRLPLIDAGVDGMGILCRHLPEGVFDDGGVLCLLCTISIVCHLQPETKIHL